MKWSLKWSDAIVIGVAESVIERNGFHITQFTIEEDFKGTIRPKSVVLVRTNPMGESCGFAFETAGMLRPRNLSSRRWVYSGFIQGLL